jgi:preprotein translocase subunit Sec61beta
MKTMKSNSIYKYRHSLSKNVKSGIVGYFSEYETPKLVLIHSFTFAILLRIMQIIILCYSVLYLLIYEKGYQKQDTAIISSVTLKVKGIGYIITAQNQTIVTDVAGISRRRIQNKIILLYFILDYIIPPSENNAIFIMTNFIQLDQTRSLCPESSTLSEAVCDKDIDCQNRPFSPRINGLWTGRCLFSLDAYVVNGTINVTRKQTGLCEYSGKLIEEKMNVF